MSIESLRSSKWTVYRPYLEIAALIALITGIVLSILAFGFPEIMQESWGWGGIGLSVFSSASFSVLIYLRIMSRKVIENAQKNGYHVVRTDH